MLMKKHDVVASERSGGEKSVRARKRIWMKKISI